MKSNERDCREQARLEVRPLLHLWEELYFDACNLCGAKTQPRDLVTLRTRTKHEGLSFLTITLSDFDVELTTALSQGQIDPTQFRAFRKRGLIPAFLQGIVCQVFDKQTGRIKDGEITPSIKALRQLTRCFKKINVNCTPQRQKKAIAAYVSDEQDLKKSIEQTDKVKFLSVSRILWGTMFRDFKCEGVLPKHGPGMTADVKKQNSKYAFNNTWHNRLEPYFPLLGNAISGLCPDNLYYNRFRAVKPSQELPVSVITVPKTLKTPRIIAMEPACMMFTQQAIKKFLYETLERSILTAGHLNFSDQTVNQRLALSSSSDERFATLDLSSASDRVQYALAIRMFDYNPELKRAIIATRSTRAQLPDKSIVTLRKFASMGSALCFPVEAMYFYTICIAALLEHRGLPVTYRDICNVSRDIYIYGDDIIVPTDAAPIVASTLQKYHCKVGLTKSFWTGKFRESCGMDAYDGRDITPIYIRQLAPRNTKECATSFISWVAMTNQLQLAGYSGTTRFLRSFLERRSGRTLPNVTAECEGLGWLDGTVKCQRWNHQKSLGQVKTFVPYSPMQKDRIDGHPALLKSLLKLEARRRSGTENKLRIGERSPTINKFLYSENHHDFSPLGDDESDNLKRSTRRGSVALKIRWVHP